MKWKGHYLLSEVVLLRHKQPAGPRGEKDEVAEARTKRANDGATRIAWQKSGPVNLGFAAKKRSAILRWLYGAVRDMGSESQKYVKTEYFLSFFRFASLLFFWAENRGSRGINNARPLGLVGSRHR